MIVIKDKKDCVGCFACQDSCPKSAVTFTTDKEGFWYPVVDEQLCVDCGICEKVCPVINADSLKIINKEAPRVFSSYNMSESIRVTSTSGGVFSAFAEKIYSDNGYIAGAVWNEDFSVKHIVSSNPKDLERIRGSKYLQSNTAGLYRSIKSVLNEGKPVLVCGCPCQMAGLRSYLRKDYDNLIIVDFVCSSINSPKVFKSYIRSLEEKYGSKMIKYHPKNKEYGGWHNFAFKATFQNGSTYVKRRTDDDFTHCFIGTHVASRPCCFSCRFKTIPRIADITIADFWGIENVNPSMDSPLGTSLVILNNKKGESFFKTIGASIITCEQTILEAKSGNRNLYQQIQPSKVDRNTFYELLDSKGFNKAMKYSRSLDESKIIALMKRVVNKFLTYANK